MTKPRAIPRSALVTGASRGIGRAFAERLASEGTQVFLLARGRAALDDVVRTIREQGGRAEAIVHDVAEVETTVRLVRELDAEVSGLHLILANAGVGMPAPDATPYAWESLQGALSTNLLGAAATLTAALPAMVERGRGHLVSTGSLASYGALPEAAAYCAPKAGLDMLLDCLRLDLRGTGVAVTNLRLGFVRTQMVARSTHPMPQMLEPDEVAREVLARLPSRPREIVLPRALGLGTRLLGALPGSVRDALWTRASERVDQGRRSGA